MEKKWLIGWIVLILILCLSGCKGRVGKKADEGMTAESIRGENTYEIAFITEKIQTDETDSVQNIWEGTEQYADENFITHNRYEMREDSSEACEEAVRMAVKRGAKIVIAGGTAVGEVFGRLQNEYPKIQFLLLDAEPYDAKGNCEKQANMHCVLFKEEEAGYLAGYSAVSEGYNRLGFLCREDTRQTRLYGYGFIQGAEDAAEEREIDLKYWNADTAFSPERIEEKVREWYREGTQAVFACGSTAADPVFKAAEKTDGKVIVTTGGQREDTKTILASVEKNYTDAAVQALEKLYANGGVWTHEQAGRSKVLGIKENGISIVKKNWNFDNFSIRDYKKILRAAEREELQLDTGVSAFPKTRNVRISIQD